jgi:hypothetical protein
MAALSRFNDAPDCDGADLRVVAEKVAELERNVANLDPSDPVFSPSTRAELLRIQAGSIERHTSLAFALADAALKSGCLDTADQAYRRLVVFYTGANYAGIRDRAKLGIDDVRAVRAGGQ